MSTHRQIRTTLALLLCTVAANVAAVTPTHAPPTLAEVYPEDFLEGTTGFGALAFTDPTIGHQAALVYGGSSTGDVIMTIAVDPATGALTFNTIQDQFGTQVFTFTATDPAANVGTFIYTVTLTPVNDDPVAVADADTTPEDAAIVVDVLANDVDVDGDVLTVVAVTQGANGTVVNNGTDVTYTPDPDFSGFDTFTYTVDDGAGGVPDTETVSITVTPVNDDPIAVGDADTTAEDLAVVVDVLANDTDPDGDTLTIVAVSQGANGTVVNNGTNVTYTPNPNFNGADSFTYTIDDGAGGAQDQATVTMTVTSVNDDPVAVADAFGATEDLAVVVPVLANDTDIDLDVLTVVAVTQSTNGTVVNNGTDVTYTPDPNFNGVDTFTYTIDDGAGGTDTATVTMTVAGVNDDPVAVTDADTTPEDVAVTVDVLLNDTDIDGDPLSVLSVTQGTSGSVTNGGANVTYTPNPDFNGGDSFTYTVNDGNGGTDTTTVTITITPVNDDPVAVGDAGATMEDTAVIVPVRANDSDIDGDPLTVSAITQGSNGSVTNGGIDVTYTPDLDFSGVDSFTYTIDDGAGGTDTETVTITISPVNDPPTVDNPVADFSHPEDGPDIVIDLNTVFGDVDIPYGDFLTFGVSTDNDPLFDLQNITGGILTLSLTTDMSGVATVTLDARDSVGASESTSFVLTVFATDDTPIPANDFAVMNEDDPTITIDVMANDYQGDPPAVLISAGVGGFSESTPTTVIDPNGDPVTDPNGTVAVVGGMVEYRPKADFYGVDSFTYTIQDLDGSTGVGTVFVTVNQVNDAPIGIQQRTFPIVENSVLTVGAAQGVLLGAYDVDGAVLDAMGNPIGSPLSAVLTIFPVVGSLIFDNVTGAFQYTPPINFVGNVDFGYRLFDNTATSGPTDYIIRVVVVATPPPVTPPPAGQVSTTFNLANVPLEQSASVPPNVLVLMDDSGSMDWNMIVDPTDPNGGMTISNVNKGNNSGIRSTSYVYQWNLPTNQYSPSSSIGRVLPTEEALAAAPAMAGNDYGVWRTRSPLGNLLYYNPQVQYTPWVGHDVTDTDFPQANPNAIRLEPRDPTNTFDMLALHSYTSTAVPQFDSNGGTQNLAVTNLYIPRYYLTTGTRPLAWNDPHTLVEIRPGMGPLPGGLYPGGIERNDCRVADNNPLDCTYAEEIQNFANWFMYYRNREHVAKSGIGGVIAAVQDIRVGYDTLQGNQQVDILPMNQHYYEGNKKDLLDTIYDIDSQGGTPLRSLLTRGGATFSCTGGAGGAACPALPAPDGFCQQNFALLFTDGHWNGGGGQPGNNDADGPGPYDGGRYADTNTSTLADVAMHFYETDIQPTYDNLVPVSARDALGAPAGTFGATMHQHMKTYAIAFGAEGVVDPATIPTDPSTPFAWPNPTSAAQHKIDDMLHAATNSRGLFLSGSDPQGLRQAIEQAFLEFSQAASSTSAAAFNSTSLQTGTLLYRGFYDLRDNTGELTATVINSDGTLAMSPTWRASDRLNPAYKAPAARRLVTFDRLAYDGVPFDHASLSVDQQLMLSVEQVDWIRGERLNEQPGGFLRQRPTSDGLLGDIVNSSPVFVGPPRGFNRDQAPYPTTTLYSTFAAAHTNREPIVYVGANDGIMHGFHGTTGDEWFGYIPNKVLDSSQVYASTLDDTSSPFYLHNYYVDLTPRLNDVWMRANDATVTKSWNSVLLGGLGAGGKGFFLLNVTDPSSQYASNANAAQSVLWEFTDEDDTYPVDSMGTPLGGAVGAIVDPLGNPVKDLGYALSLPTVTMSNAMDGGEQAWIALFGNGVNSTAGIAKLFILNLDGGFGGWGPGDFTKIDTGAGVVGAPDPLAGHPNGLGSATAVDRDLNGTADWVYAGDRLGNLYRFDITDSDPTNWFSTRLFSTEYDDGTTVHRQPILARPLVVRHPTEAGFLVIFGTGSFVTREDASDQSIQSIYAIWDRGEASPAMALAGSKTTRLVEQTITNVVDDSINPAITRRIVSRNPVNYTPETAVPGTFGWYIDLDMERASSTISGAANPDTSGLAPPGPQFPGEKAIRRLLFRDGTVITTTVLPAVGASSCFGARPGSILVFDALTGGDAVDPIIDFNTDGDIDSGDLVDVGGESYAGGILFNQEDLDGSLVDLSTLGGEGDTDWLFVSGGNETISYRIDDINDSRTGRLSWQRLEASN